MSIEISLSENFDQKINRITYGTRLETWDL